MKEQNNVIKIKEKNWEGVLVIVLLLVVFAVVTPYVVRIVHDAQITRALSSSQGLENAIKTTYTEGNLTGIISLPFELKYEDKEYFAYSNGEKINIKEIKLDGTTPKSGSIIINKKGEVEIKDLDFGLVSCNKAAEDSETTCK